MAPWRSPRTSDNGDTPIPRCAGGSSTWSLRRTMGAPPFRHSSMRRTESAGSTSRHGRPTASAGRPSKRRPAGLTMRRCPWLSTTSNPDARLSTISLLKRSEASARADITRSCAFSRVTASCSAAVTKALSVVRSRSSPFERRAAMANRTTANTSTAITNPAKAVSPKTAATDGFIGAYT